MALPGCPLRFLRHIRPTAFTRVSRKLLETVGSLKNPAGFVRSDNHNPCGSDGRDRPPAGDEQGLDWARARAWVSRPQTHKDGRRTTCELRERVPPRAVECSNELLFASQRSIEH